MPRLVAIGLLLAVVSPGAFADGRGGVSASDVLALNAIFGDEFLADDVFAVREAAAELPPEQRYRFLVAWILPGEGHATFRIQGEFQPTYFAARTEAARGRPPYRNRGSFDDAIVAPLLDLIEVSRQTGRLDDLSERVASSNVDGVRQRRSRAAARFLVELARDDLTAATAAFDELAALRDDASAEARWPELLVLWAGLRNPNTRRMVAEQYFSEYTDLVPYTTDAELDVTNDYLRTLLGYRRFLGSGNAGSRRFCSPLDSGVWLSFSYADAQTRRRGRPPAHWEMGDGQAQKLSGHELDYLSLRSPLRGDFAVECDLTTGLGVNLALLVAGTHAEAIDGGARLNFGGFRHHVRATTLDPPLTSFQHWVRARAVVRDGTLTHYLNGRPVLKKKLSPDHVPWVAVRAWRRSHGHVRNLRITGAPAIPDSLRLTADPELSGWTPYFADDFDSLEASWRTLSEGGATVGLFGRHLPELRGAVVENLIRYARPISEDGEVEYEFFYRPGGFHAHPALDRLVFLLRPDGVRIHRLTDGKYERTGLAPDNDIVEPACRRGPAELPLNENDWNRLRLSLRGDTVTLELNGQAVYERDLGLSNDRTFGLFHFADRTAAKVRHVTWRGSWPNELPPAPEQELAASELDFLDETSAKLGVALEHDFREGVPAELFDFTGDETVLHKTSAGVRTELAGDRGLHEMRLCLRLHGDFDIVAGFEDLEIEMPVAKGRAGIGLMAFLENETQDSFALYRRNGQPGRDRRAAFAHKALRVDGSIDYTGKHLVEESTSGRLRLTRQGETVYALYAEGDSPNFRLVSQHPAPAGDLALQGLRLVQRCAESLAVRVTWTRLSVRAERISGTPVEHSEPIVKSLNDRRDDLSGRTVDFSDPAEVEGAFVVKGEANFRQQTDRGLRLRVPSDGPQQTAALYGRFSPGADFDVEADSDLHRLDDPQRLGVHSEIRLQVLLRATEAQEGFQPTEATLIIRQKANGARLLIARLVGRDRVGSFAYRPIRSVPVRSPEKLRIACHEGKLYFLYGEASLDGERVLAECAAAPGVAAESVVLMVFTNGEGRLTEVTWKRLAAYGKGETFQPLRPLAEEE